MALFHQQKNGDVSVVSGINLKVVIENPNSEDIQTFTVTTNESGSFSGEFNLPKNTITGEFEIFADEPDDLKNDPKYDRIADEHPFWDNVNFDDGHVSFSVEEYKRPKFEASFSPVMENVAVNQKVSVKGSAKAFAGTSISDAKVNYSVTRISYRNYLDFQRFQQEDEDEIISGETNTDASGKFTVDFIAAPDDKDRTESIYSYRIKADITDINGETHSANTIIKAGHRTLEIDSAIPDIVKTKNKNFLTLTSRNLNGQFKAVNGIFKIYFIKPFDYRFKNRTWEQPEFKTISDSDFSRLFPYEKTAVSDFDFNVEDNTEGTLVYTKKVNTGKQKDIPLDFMANYKSGRYKVVFSATDDLQNELESTQLFQILQSKEPFVQGKLFSFEQQNDNPQKDGFVELAVTSCVPQIYVMLAASRESKTFFEQQISLTGNKTIVKIPLPDDLSGDVVIGGDVVFSNDSFHEELRVSVPQEKDMIIIEAESFRDKLQPGIPESWTFRISPSDGAKTEVLASMYDSSLDQFANRNWPGLSFGSPYNYLARKNPVGFGVAEFALRGLGQHYR
ncbi:MAG: hypothetical protein EOO48_12570, partial [Flavobacterium sp.]